MPHVDEMLGVATLGAVGLVAAIALQPTLETDAAARRAAPVVAPATGFDTAPIVRLPPLEVVARRSVEMARADGDARPPQKRPPRHTAGANAGA